MDKQQAQEIIKNTFESPFDKVRFTNFIKNLLNSIDESKAFHAHGYVKEGFSGIIKTYERIGTYNSTDDKKIDIIIVYLQKGFSLDHARVTQRNFAGRYLVDRGEKDAGLFAFVSPDETDWRFSLVKMDYKFEQTKSGRMKVKEEFTPARRWSFLVGANEKSHTAQSQMVKILADDEHDPTLAELEQAFDIETVTKEFFEKYRELFLRTKEELDRVVKKDPKIKADFEDNGVDTVNFAKKLLGQIVFLYFLQKKGWFGVGRDDDWGTGSKHFLRELFDLSARNAQVGKKHGDYNNFFNDILEPLFYDALRNDRSHDDGYYSRFNCKIPFLNGGLFDPIGNYDWVHTDILIPDELFSNNVKTKESDTGTGILDVFDRYNFTVKEDEPLEKEVAIDPELLGKSYEKFNAIRPDNYAEFRKALKSGRKGEENKFNKKFGVYYTPREIVHYMCQQSLINYLNSELNSESSSYQKLGDSQLDMFGNKTKKGQLDLTIEHKAGISIRKEDIETLIHAGEQFSENEARVLLKGKETKTYFHQLPESIRRNAKLIDDKLAEITVCDPAVGSGAFPVGMMSEIVKTRNVLTTFVTQASKPETEHRQDACTTYNFKRQCIEHSLYGVDIDPGAVEIAKLRLWLSLVVDEDDIKNIKPLPNLDYKIVCGNSLLGVEKDLFNFNLFNELEKLKPLFFNETNPTKKHEYKKQIDDLICQITSGHKEFDFEVYFSEVFHEKDGFDVVIGNPPYVQLQKEGGKLANLYKNLNYVTFERTGDIYALFYENGIKNLKIGGHLCFITSNKWMRAGYGKSLRKLFNSYNPFLLVNLGPGIFESATVDTNILIIGKEKNQSQLSGITLNAEAKDAVLSDFINKNKTILPKMGEDAWFIGNQAEQNLKEKFERIGKPLKEWDVNIYRGILTGLNKAFVIDTATRDRLVAEDPKSAEILKPILRGRDIKRYSYDWAGLWLIFIPWHFPLHKNESIQGASKKAEEEFQKQYPAIYKHILQFKDQLSKRNTAETGIRYEWYALQRCAATYYPEFEKEKVVWQEMSKESSFSYDNNSMYCNDTGRIMIGKKIKFFVAIFNSRFFCNIFSRYYAGGELGAEGIRFKHTFMGNIPIPPITPSNKSIVEKTERFVEKILAITKDDDYLENSAKQARVKEYEKQIDQLVYKLYDLTPEEIKIVEGDI